MSDEVENGIDDLEKRRAKATGAGDRVQRQPPPPKVRRKRRDAAAEEDTFVPSREITRETIPEGVKQESQESAEEGAGARPVEQSSAIAPEAVRASSAEVPAVPTGEGPPVLEVDLSDPLSLKAAPTTLNVPASVVERFEAARPVTTKHAALMLHAIRTEAEHLPELVLARRPELLEGDPFPLRAVPGEEHKSERAGTLRVRPIRAEVEVLDRLTAWVDAEVQRRRPGGRRVSRSEVVTAALDAYLPPLKRSRK